MLLTWRPFLISHGGYAIFDDQFRATDRAGIFPMHADGIGALLRRMRSMKIPDSGERICLRMIALVAAGQSSLSHCFGFIKA